MLVGLKFYGNDGSIVIRTGLDWVAYSGFKTHTVHLADGERVIGYKSRSHPDYACHFDFQLIIGSLE